MGGDAVPYTKAGNEATKRWKKANQEEIKIPVPKGERELIKGHAYAQGESLNGFVYRAIKETMARDNKTPED